jgi:hypothetical protein
MPEWRTAMFYYRPHHRARGGWQRGSGDRQAHQEHVEELEKVGVVRISDELDGKLWPSEKGRGLLAAIEYRLIRF